MARPVHKQTLRGCRRNAPSAASQHAAARWMLAWPNGEAACGQGQGNDECERQDAVANLGVHIAAIRPRRISQHRQSGCLPHGVPDSRPHPIKRQIEHNEAGQIKKAHERSPLGRVHRFSTQKALARDLINARNAGNRKDERLADDNDAEHRCPNGKAKPCPPQRRRNAFCQHDFDNPSRPSIAIWQFNRATRKPSPIVRGHFQC